MRRADSDAVKEFTDDDGDVLVLRVELTKAIADEVQDLSRHYVLTDEGAKFDSAVAAVNRRLFEVLTVRFTIGGENVDPTASEYARLDVQSGRWVDDCIGEILELREKRAEGNDDSPTPAELSLDDLPPAEPSTLDA